MALKRNETYPGRFSNPTSDHPQGAFKNRSAPGAQDGSYLEQQWANDWDGFFGRLLTVAGITPDGDVDTALASQYFDALKSLFLQRTNPFGDIKTDGTVDIALENLGLGNTKYGAPLIGQLVEWPLQQMPHEIWPDMGQEYIPYMAQSFDPVKYPLLSQLHPTNVLPADMRGYGVRGWDNARGVDTGRTLMSAQSSGAPNITGDVGALAGVFTPSGNGAMTYVFAGASSNTVAGTNSGLLRIGIDASKSSTEYQAITEVRSKNVAWNMIVRAK